MSRNNEHMPIKKAKLTRGVAYDEGSSLSPVTDESNKTFGVTQNEDNYVPLTDLSTHSGLKSRSPSPLPPLIIEKVSQANKHDEPEEYYQKLLIKMRRIYRKVFIENKDLSSEDDDLISLCDSDTKQTSGSNDTSLDQTQNFLLDNISETVNVDFEERSNGYEAAQAMEDSSDDDDYRQITTEAMVHVDGAQDAAQQESLVYEDSVRSFQETMPKARCSDSETSAAWQELINMTSSVSDGSSNKLGHRTTDENAPKSVFSGRKRKFSELDSP